MSEYLIPAQTSTADYEIKHSRFITEVRPILSNTEMKQFLREKREQHPKASHNCWALIAGAPTNSNLYGFSDDGEPCGSAGKPMFTVLQYSGAGQIGMIITRYFGGTKLGIGGLVKAYTEAAKLGMEAAILTPYAPMQQLTIENLPYAKEPHLRHLFEQAGLHQADFQYAEGVYVSTPIRADESEGVVSQLKAELGHDLSIDLTQALSDQMSST